MKIQIEFDNQEDALHALSALKYFSALQDHDNYLRKLLKYNDLPDAVYHEVSKVRDNLSECCSDFALWE